MLPRLFWLLFPEQQKSISSKNQFHLFLSNAQGLTRQNGIPFHKASIVLDQHPSFSYRYSHKGKFFSLIVPSQTPWRCCHSTLLLDRICNPRLVSYKINTIPINYRIVSIHSIDEEKNKYSPDPMPVL
ncbi:hypothetical protein AVEN_40186-1 [Araneus ventricosus]|uniref:Uncharacterized protein n=1 Tax=Araneus ventricosus TaxID=182803 RepID=A0A4Y2K021_ARAVE|nr:hypothetical protein AVEN_40186-1 [Araneus ventricosus]